MRLVQPKRVSYTIIATILLSAVFCFLEHLEISLFVWKQILFLLFLITFRYFLFVFFKWSLNCVDIYMHMYIIQYTNVCMYICIYNMYFVYDFIIANHYIRFLAFYSQLKHLKNVLSLLSLDIKSE